MTEFPQETTAVGTDAVGLASSKAVMTLYGVDTAREDLALLGALAGWQDNKRALAGKRNLAFDSSFDICQQSLIIIMRTMPPGRRH